MEILKKIWDYIKIIAAKIFVVSKIVLKKAWKYIKILSVKVFIVTKAVSKRVFIFLKSVFNKLKIKYNNLSSQNKKKVNIIGASLCGIIIISIILSIIFSTKPVTVNNITFGTSTVQAVNEITTTGGEIVINDEKSAINGFKLTVPEGSYNMPLDFVVKTYPVSSHNFGNDFNILTPIIEINNGHEYSNETMRVEIPLTLNENSFPMGFYYNDADGSLEPIPVIDVTQTKIILGVKHFSKIIVSDIPLSVIQKLTSGSGSNLDTEFVPGLDDWHYTNYGSAISMGGHCAGQSLTMSWYYSEKYKKENQPRLYGRFDNNEEIDTPDFWQDDNNAYRFSSVIQETIDFSSSKWIDFINYCMTNPEKTFYAFAYAINITKTPQLMAIFPDSGSGHAVVAYKIEGNKIFVADPNFPGQKDRYVEYNPTLKKFNAYSSGANAADITAYGTTSYTKIVYAAKSALVDYDTISKNYNKIDDKTIGDDLFPDTLVEVATNYNGAIYEKADRTINLGLAYKNSLPLGNENKGFIKVTPEYTSTVYSLYINDVLQSQPNVTIDGNSLYYTVDLNEGENNISFLVEYEVSDGNNYSYYYVDYIRITINLLNITPKSVMVFDTRGGSGIADITKNVGETVTAPSDPEKTGYDFGGWYKDLNFTESYIFSVMPNANIILYAKWIEKNLENKVDGTYYLYTVNGNKNITPIEYQYYEIKEDKTYNEVYKSKDNDIITNSGTWQLTGDKLTFTNNNGIYEVTTDGEYLYDLPTENPYFIYKRKINVDVSVTISFESNGGSAVSPITQNAGSSVTPPNPPLKNNNTFMGWYSDIELTIPFSFNKMPYKDIILYAKWTDNNAGAVKIHLTYHSSYPYNVEFLRAEYPVGEPFPYSYLDMYKSIKPGHRFSGYYIDENCTTPLDYTNVPANDVYVYIKWTKITLAESYGKYNKENIDNDYLDYHYIEFFANGTCKITFKYKSRASEEPPSNGIYTVRDIDGIIFDVDMDSDPFPETFIVYDGEIHSSRSGDWIKE